MNSQCKTTADPAGFPTVAGFGVGLVLRAFASLETTEVGFFALNDLPALSIGRTLAEDIEQAYAAHLDPSRPPLLD